MCLSIDKEMGRYPHMEYYSVTKRNGVLTRTTTWLNLESIMLMKEGRHKDHMLYDSMYIKS